MQRRASQYQEQNERRHQPGEWREENREFGAGELEFGSPHDQGLPHEPFPGGSRKFGSGGGRERGYPLREWEQGPGREGAAPQYGRAEYYAPSRGYRRRYSESAGSGYDEGRREEWRPSRRFTGSRDYPDENYYGYRPEPRGYQKGYGPLESESRQGWQRSQRESGPYEQGRYQGGPRREQYGEPRPSGDYGRREPMRSSDREGREDYYSGREYFSRPRQPGFRQERPYGGYEPGSRQMRGGYGPEPEYGYEQRGGGQPYGPAERREERYPGERRPQGDYPEGRSWDERRDYEEWLREHEGRDRGSEAERQLEGLREEHRSHRSDYRHDEERQGGQPRSQRRLEEDEQGEEQPVTPNRATQMRAASKSSSSAGKTRKASTRSERSR